MVYFGAGRGSEIKCGLLTEPAPLHLGTLLPLPWRVAVRLCAGLDYQRGWAWLIWPRYDLMVVSPGGLCQGLATLNVGRQAVQRSQESSSWTTTVFAVVLMPWMSACRFWKLGYRIFYSCGKQNTLCFARSLTNGKICCNIMRVHVVGLQLESMTCVFKTVSPSKDQPGWNVINPTLPRLRW